MSPIVEIFRRGARARAGLFIVLSYAIVAVVGPFIVEDPGALVGIPLQPPSFTHWLGTTGQGQDVFAQLVVGTRNSLLVGLLTGGLVVVIGAAVGIVGAYLGGPVDAALSWGTQVSLVLPGLPLAIVVAAYLPSGPLTVAAVLVLTGWAWNARVLRSQTLSLRTRDFVIAARVAGDGPLRIMTTVIAPNLLSLLFAQWMGSVTYAIGAEVGLEFLGLGDVGTVTWGTSLYWAANDAALLTGAWWTFVPAGLASAFFACALVWMGAALDEVTNPRLFSAHPWSVWLKARGHDPVAALAVTPVVVATAYKDAR
jgi:peptide/nickel transport system permease protein